MIWEIQRYILSSINASPVFCTILSMSGDRLDPEIAISIGNVIIYFEMREHSEPKELDTNTQNFAIYHLGVI